MSAPQLFQNTSVFNFIHKCIQYNYHCDYPSFLQAASANGSAIPLKLISVLHYKQVHLQSSQFELLPAYGVTDGIQFVAIHGARKEATSLIWVT